MTISTQTRSAGPFSGNGATTVFPFSFKVFQASDLLVARTDTGQTQTTLALSTDYTVTLNSDQNTSPGGFLTLLVPLPVGYTLTFTSNIAITQPVSLTNAGGFFPRTIEDELDRLTILLQQQAALGAQALRVPEVAGVPPLGTAASRANYLLGFDSSGNPIAVAPASGSAAALAADLASTASANKNAGQIGFSPALAYPAGTVGNAIKNAGSNLVDARVDYSAVIDGATDNLTAMNAALAAPHAELFVEEGLDLRVSAVPTDAYGPRVGPGRVIVPVTNGRRQINSDAELRTHMFGQEYLYYAQNKLRARTTFVARFSGDSTTAGDSLASVNYQIHSLVQQAVRDKGFDFTTATNAGHSGVTAEQWRTTYLADDIAANPDLYVIRWGINDPAYKKDGAAGTPDAYESELALRRDITDYATTMRAALTTIRASKTVAQMSIILMVPNSTSDSPNGRDEKWYEQVARVLRKCARDFQCAFIDTYALWRDSRAAAGLWMDNPYSDGRAIHPLDIMNTWIASSIADLLIPSAMSLRNVGATFATPVIATAPSAYPVGYSTFRVYPSWTINGVAVDGMVVTIRGADGVCLQFVVDYTAQRRVAERVGFVGTNVWQDWISTPTNTTPLALSNGWTDSGRGITYDKVGGLVHVRGRITGGTTTVGTLIATLPAGFTPVFDEYRAVRCGSSLNTDATIVISSVNPGQIQVMSVSSNALLDIGCTFSIF